MITADQITIAHKAQRQRCATMRTEILHGRSFAILIAKEGHTFAADHAPKWLAVNLVGRAGDIPGIFWPDSGSRGRLCDGMKIGTHGSLLELQLARCLIGSNNDVLTVMSSRMAPLAAARHFHSDSVLSFGGAVTCAGPKPGGGKRGPGGLSLSAPMHAAFPQRRKRFAGLLMAAMPSIRPTSANSRYKKTSGPSQSGR